MSKQNDYNKDISKEVKPRYLHHYQQEGIYIITVNKDIYNLHLRYIKANYSKVIAEKQGKYYIIKAEGLK